MRNSNGKRNKRPDEISCVQLTEGTKAELSELGKRGDTFESIILNLMKDKPCSEKTVGENESE